MAASLRPVSSRSICISVDALSISNADGSRSLVAAPVKDCDGCRQCGIAQSGHESARAADARAVRLSLPGRSLILMCLVLYGGPLIGLLMGVALAAATNAGDIVAGVLALFGMLCAAGLLHGAARRLELRIGAELGQDAGSVDRADPGAMAAR